MLVSKTGGSGAKQTELVNENYGKSSWTRREAMAHKQQHKKYKLNDSNIPLTHTMQLLGHRNVQSVNNYTCVSKKQQKNMSLIPSSNPAESNAVSDAKENAACATSATTALTAEAEASFIKTSMFPLAASLGKPYSMVDILTQL